MDDNGEVRDDIRLPDSDLGKEIQSKFDAGDQLLVTVISAMAEEAAIQIKNMPKWGTPAERHFLPIMVILFGWQSS